MGVRAICAWSMGLLALCAMPAAGGDHKWIKAETPHFTILSDSSAKTVSGYALKLEQYHYVLAGFYGLSPEADAELPKLRLYFVNDPLDMKQAWPNIPMDVAGWYKACTEGQVAVAAGGYEKIKSSQKLEDQTQNDSQTILFHEYTHTFMFQVTDTRYPAWFVEGFAEYYGTTRIGDGEALVGMAWQDRVDRLLTDGYGMPYDAMLRDKPDLHANPTKEDEFYAQSWVLTHWIMSDPTRRAQFGAYVKAINGGADPVAAFESIMGVKVADLERLMRAYLHHMQAQAYRVDNMPTPNIAITTMPASADKLMMWDAALRMCPAKADWAGLTSNVTAEAAKFPGDDFAQTTLARLQIEIGDETQGLPYLTNYTAKHPDDAEAAYMLGQAWYLSFTNGRTIAGETKATELQKARTWLGKAYTLDPLNAADLYYFALSQQDQPGYPDDNALTSAVQAHDLAPSVSSYALLAAELLVETGDMQTAKTMLYPLASNPHGGAIRSWASGIITAIDNGASKDEVLKLMRTQSDSKGDDK